MLSVESTLEKLKQMDYTENGALGYKSSGHALLDLNFRAASLRGAEESEICELFMAAFAEDELLALKWLFFARDIREGLGERKLFRVILKRLAQVRPVLVEKLIPLVQEYGRFDDLLPLLDSACSESVIAYIGATLEADAEKMKAGMPISLLAKWLPSVNTASQASRRMGRRIAAQLKLSERNYRKTLSGLRRYIDVTECKMSAGEWPLINYSRVPSRAALLYRAAFYRHDEDRYRDFISRVADGSAKMNAAALFPHDIVHQYVSGGWSVRPNDFSPELEALWANLPNTVSSEQRILVVRDGSGSMTTSIGNSSVSALDCSTALAIYFAEHMSGKFKDKFITFSRVPKLIDLSACTSLHDKLMLTYREDDCSNTDIHAVFRLILKSAVDHNISQEEMPSSILIISDMEFDGHSFTWEQPLFEAIAAEYEAQGYKLPKLIFWNLNSRTKIVPLTQNPLGVILVSGFSLHIAKMVMSAQLDPYKALVEILLSDRYSNISSNLFRCIQQS